MQSFVFNRLNDVEVKKENQVKPSNRFPGLECMNAMVDSDGAWEIFRENVSAKIFRNVTNFNSTNFLFDE